MPGDTGPLARRYRYHHLVIRDRAFVWGERTYLMAVINVTPDSFSGDGLGGDVAAAVALARRFEADGADIIDIGGESTRPGAEPLAPEAEIARVIPAVTAIRAVTSLPISIDTTHAAVVEAALAAGADIVNDITGLRGDPAVATVAARHGAPVVAMHNQRGLKYHNVVRDIEAGFHETLRLAHEAGIPGSHIILDPGFGFGWTPEQNLEMLRRLPELWDLELPLLVGVSRKSTLGFVLDTPVEDRLEGTAAAVSLCVAGGADIVRVHDVREMRRVVRVADAIARANWHYQQ
jgi:dihydropteroate synthase